MKYRNSNGCELGYFLATRRWSGVANIRSSSGKSSTVLMLPNFASNMVESSVLSSTHPAICWSRFENRSEISLSDTWLVGCSLSRSSLHSVKLADNSLICLCSFRASASRRSLPSLASRVCSVKNSMCVSRLCRSCSRWEMWFSSISMCSLYLLLSLLESFSPRAWWVW